ncbi:MULTISPECIES: flagellar export protein FliJ [Bacillaceae]|uniref:flagellar export protein FliJ n=1 Tax=Bacillaceae TaxID=186817 RepID=UPI000B9C4F27|nr:flagellar export protein FliJ [Bacillus infantis]MCK6206201.1 flagellar biosynthesis chaperone FliJ [Bacillus infantis]MCR6610473.1 flagellar biosynthesis chaperone FliJ [Bacillus infantis]MDW2876942.1 flagellar export protein FliJ [Bacillus infantis]OXT18655.1 flagellar export protein FliJ [Bacillus sp. OG2]
MTYNFRFDKILTVKNREKEEALDVYNQSVKRFEEAAEALFELLKKKEDLEGYQNERLLTGLPVQEIRHHQFFINNLEKTIDHYQKMVINTRTHMVYHQERLVEKNIEVKKYEKIKEKDLYSFIEDMKLTESRLMDDISIQSYMNRER